MTMKPISAQIVYRSSLGTTWRERITVYINTRTQLRYALYEGKARIIYQNSKHYFFEYDGKRFTVEFDK